MSTLNLHPAITEKLNYFLQTEKIPNIIFHGSSGSGKRTIVHKFVCDIYHNNKELMKAYVMNVNCAHGKGIKFVREDLKFFAKTHINIQGSGHFKTVILSNADNLTTDAQSALRRCIELFCHTTRFFIIVEDKYKLLKPILSRLCEIFVPEPIIDNKRVNLHKFSIQKTFGIQADKKKATWLKNNLIPPKDYISLLDLTDKLYEKGYSGLDLMEFILGALPSVAPALAVGGQNSSGAVPPAISYDKDIECIEPLQITSKMLTQSAVPSIIHGGLEAVGTNTPTINGGLEAVGTNTPTINGGLGVLPPSEKRKYQLLLTFHKVKKEFRNEKLFMTFILNFYFLRSDLDLENISFM